MASNSWLRAAVTTLVTAALGLLSLTVVTPAYAAYSNGKCADNTGLNVVVDYKDGRAPDVRCVENWQGGTGLAGFQAAGFGVKGVGGSLEFICQINQFPASERCDTYPEKGFWSYWTSTSGSWEFSNYGVVDTKLQSGNWQGFSFSSVNSSQSNPKPSVTPTVPGDPKPKPTPTNTTKPSETPSSKPKPKPGGSETSKPKPSAPSATGNKPGSSATKTQSPDATTSPDAEEQPEVDKPEISEKDDPTEEPDDTTTADDETEREESDKTKTETQTSPEYSDDQSGEDSAPSAHKTGADDAGGPPTGTLIALGAVLLISSAAIVRHRARTNAGQSSNNSESN